MRKSMRRKKSKSKVRKNSRDSIIYLRNVTKIFKIPHEKKNTLMSKAISFMKKNVSYEKLYALKNINLNIRKGELVGIIGPNAGGKTTLLKTIAGIFNPSKGKVTVKGRAAPLLELGVGFEPDLSGKENIFLSGIIMGLSKKEIKEKFNEIVEFAGLKRFIDMPVKNYSSGMYSRLAFAMALQTKGDIFLIDEIFSVGDEEFQKKCSRLFNTMKENGKTVLFVSHNMGAVSTLCERTILIDNGKILLDGKTSKVIDFYDKFIRNREAHQKTLKLRRQAKKIRENKEQIMELARKIDSVTGGPKRRSGNKRAIIKKVELLDGTKKTKRIFKQGRNMTIKIHYCAKEKITNPMFGIAIHKEEGIHVTGPNNIFAKKFIKAIEGAGVVSYAVKSLPLIKGNYFLTASIHDSTGKESFDYHNKYYCFKVTGGNEKYGCITLKGKWHFLE